MVSELINQAEVAWKYNMLEEFFTPLDAMMIAKIPLCTRRQEDFWMGTLTNEAASWYARRIICWSIDRSSMTHPCGIL